MNRAPTACGVFGANWASSVPRYSVSIDTVAPSAQAVPLNINAPKAPRIAVRAKLFVDLGIMRFLQAIHVLPGAKRGTGEEAPLRHGMGRAMDDLLLLVLTQIGWVDCERHHTTR